MARSLRRSAGRLPGRSCTKSPLECNLYAYARGNPLTFSDPSGQDTADEAVAEIMQSLQPEDALAAQRSAAAQGWSDFSNMKPVGGVPDGLLQTKLPFPTDLEGLGMSPEQISALQDSAAAHDSVIKANYWMGVTA